MSLNTVCLIGRMTANADTREIENGTSVAKFSLAVSEFVKGEERASFFDITAFGKTAEIIRDYTSKGLQLGIVGNLKQERWESENGKRSKVIVIAQRIDLLSKKKEENEPKQKPPSQNNNSGYDDLNDDLPFQQLKNLMHLVGAIVLTKYKFKNHRESNG